MQGTKLLKLLKLLSEEEIRQLKKLVQSPFFTTNENILRLYNVLRAAHPEFKSGIEKEKVFKKVFPKHEFSDSKVRNLFRDMTQLVEQFLIHKELEENTIPKRKLLLKILGERRNAELFEKEENKIKTALEKTAFRDHIYFRNLLDVNSSRLDNIAPQKIKLRAEHLQDSLFLLEMYYQISKEKIETELISFSGIIDLAEKDIQPEKNLMLDIYNKVQALYLEDNLVAFEGLKNLFFGNLPAFRKSMQQEILTLLLNFGIKKMKEDDFKFNQVVFDLYKVGIEKEILFEENKMSCTTFLNSVVASAKAGAFEWTYSFMDKFDAYLDKEMESEMVEDVRALSKSYLFFYEQKFNEAVDLVEQHIFKHDLYKRSAKIHSIRCYFELFLKDHNYYDLLDNRCAAFKQYLYRDGLALKENREAMRNFCAFLGELVSERLKGNLDKETKGHFLDLLKNYKTIYSRSWLKDKIEQ